MSKLDIFRKYFSMVNIL